MPASEIGIESLSLLRAREALAATPPAPRWGPEGGAASDPERWKASLDFQTMFLSQMYKAMRQTVAHNELTEPSFARDLFTEMFDREVAAAPANSPFVSGPAGMLAAQNGQSQSLAAQIYRSLGDSYHAPLEGATHESPLRGAFWVDETATLHALPPNLLRAMIQAESGWNPNALSPKGAKGLMQLMDDTSDEMGVRNPFDPRENVMGGARYLRALLDRFGGDERKALAGYNAGPAAVDRHGGVPPFPETRDYLIRVLRIRAELDAEAKP